MEARDSSLAWICISLQLACYTLYNVQLQGVGAVSYKLQTYNLSYQDVYVTAPPARAFPLPMAEPMSRPSRSLAPVDYSGLDEPGEERPVKRHKIEQPEPSAPSVSTAPAIPKKMAPIFAKSPAAQAKPETPGASGGFDSAKAKIAPKPKPAPSKPKAASSSGLEMHRRTLGDAVKARIHVEKWCIGASCHCTTQASLDVFRRLIVPNAADVTPVGFDADTPVVVASVRGTASAGEIFGKTKITGGTRMGSWSANKMELVFFPPTGELRIWWTMR